MTTVCPSEQSSSNNPEYVADVLLNYRNFVPCKLLMLFNLPNNMCNKCLVQFMLKVFAISCILLFLFSDVIRKLFEKF
jgi:hypothetical protein